jgi:hypothetical protein
MDHDSIVVETFDIKIPTEILNVLEIGSYTSSHSSRPEPVRVVPGPDRAVA